MNKQPKLKIALTTTDKVLEMLGWAGVLAIWVLTIANFQHLPDTIPVHYNFAGEPDRFGSKGSLFILPVVATVLYTGLTTLNNYPHLFNYLTLITTDNARKQYTTATKIIRYIKVIIVVIFGFIVWHTIGYTQGQ